jgi:hypothetical protein
MYNRNKIEKGGYIKLIYKGEVIRSVSPSIVTHKSVEYWRKVWAKLYPKEKFEQCLITDDLSHDNLVDKGITLPEPKNTLKQPKIPRKIKSNTSTQRYKVQINQKTPF